MLFRFAIAFLKHAEEDILQQNGTFQVNRYMRSIGQKMVNSKVIARVIILLLVDYIKVLTNIL